MGRADSPLRDHVIFVEGAPRSGTTWLATLLATHPEIAGTEAESHLFDAGVNRLFDSFEGRGSHPHLQGYVERDELVDLVRDLCDGVLMAMRSHVSGAERPAFVMEKTPLEDETGALDMARKRECYPDAWYMHIVRDRHAVARSLMRAPWMPDRSYAACAGRWDRAVNNARENLGDLPRYREVSYEELRADPGESCRALFGWLGVGADDDVVETVRMLSQEQYSDLGVVAPRSISGRLIHRARAVVKSQRDRVWALGRYQEPGSEMVLKFVSSLRKRDAETLRSLTASSFEFVYRSADGDLSLRGDDGREALVKIAEETFRRRYVGEWWASAGGPMEWWTAAAGKPLWTIFVSALGGDATRVDIAIGLVLEDDLIRRAVVISAGPLAGRPVIPRDRGERTRDFGDGPLSGSP